MEIITARIIPLPYLNTYQGTLRVSIRVFSDQDLRVCARARKISQGRHNLRYC